MSKKRLLVEPQTTPLKGTITVPGDKSISHRAVMFGSIAAGRSVIRSWLPAGDTLATLNAFQKMGIPIGVSQRTPQQWDLVIHGQGLRGLQPPIGAIDCVNAGTFMRVGAGIMVGQTFPSVLDGSPQLRKRPMRRITDPLRTFGANIEDQDGRAPLHVTPTPLSAIDYEMNVASAQVKSALLLAGMYADGTSRIREPGPTRDHTERMLQAMGLDIQRDGSWLSIAGPVANDGLAPLDLTVPADPSSAAFVMVAAATIPHSDVTITNVGVNATRTGLFGPLGTMGAAIDIKNERTTGGEPAADITIRFDELHNTHVSGDTIVCGIDEWPIFAIAASQGAGVSSVREAAELRHKEVDRISVLAGELRKMNIPLDEFPDGYSIEGPLRPHGAVVDSHDDHRLGMTLAVAGLLADSPTVVEDAGCIADSFPGFVETMQSLGASMRWETD